MNVLVNDESLVSTKTGLNGLDRRVFVNLPSIPSLL